MGTWGPGLYQNDVSEDIRSYFADQLRRGKNAELITQELMDSYRDVLEDSEDAPNFWLALADVQWNMGRLLPMVKERALSYLEDGSNSLILEQFSRKNAAKRRIVFDKLSEKLHSPQPPEKKVSLYRLYRCTWKKGDVFVLPLESPRAQALGISDGYLLLEKAGEREYHPGHTIPVMYAKITDKHNYPTSLDQYNKLEYIKVSSQWIDTRNVKELVPSDSSYSAIMIRSIDENGYQTTYRVALITTSAKSLPPKLTYLGNFCCAEHPEKEYIPLWDVNIPAYTWNEIERQMLLRYPKTTASPLNED